MTFYLSDGKTIEVAASGPSRPLSSEQEAALLRANARTGELPESRPDVRRNLQRKSLLGEDGRLTDQGLGVVRALHKHRGSCCGASRQCRH